MTDKLPTLEVTDVTSDRLQRLQMQIEFESLPDVEKVLSLAASVCTAFGRAACVGAFAPRAALRRQSFLALRSAPVLEDGRVVAEFDVIAIDTSSFQFFRNMMLGLNDAGAAMERIILVAAGSREPPQALAQIDDRNESSLYPRVPPPLAIGQVGFSPSEFSKSRRVLIEFSEFPSPPEMDVLQSYVDSWYDLLELGAFCQPFGTPDETIGIRGSFTRFDSTSVEAHIQRYIGSEVGFKILGSMLDHYADLVYPILSVEFD